MTSKRDWQADGKVIYDFNNGYFPSGGSDNLKAIMTYFHFASDALPYYHQQYAAEKERADKAEVELTEQRNNFDYIVMVKDTYKKRLDEWGNRAIEAEAREQKLKEAIKKALGEYKNYTSPADNMASILGDALKEESQ